MPIIRSSDQKNETLEEFYKELTSKNATVVENKIGKAMLEFISMVNETFEISTLFGLTSHFSLVIQATDNYEDGWFVAVYSIGEQKFQIEYKMSEKESPWNFAIVKGQANTIDEAREFLIIAMTESEGWSDNKELRKLYQNLQSLKTENPKFTLWLEFENINTNISTNNWNKENEFCNIHVDLEDGRHYGINVWTYKYLETAINNDKKTGQNLNGLYLTPPDLFVTELTRECIQQTIEDLLKIDDLEKVLNQNIYGKQIQK